MPEAQNFRRTHLDGYPRHPSTRMMSCGYDPAMSQGAGKLPVFLTSTCAFTSAGEAAAFFDVVAGRKPAPPGGGAGGRGGTESLVCHPAPPPRSGVSAKAREHAAVAEGLIRLPVGLEHPADLNGALHRAARA